MSRCSHTPTFGHSEKCITSEKLYLAKFYVPSAPFPRAAFLQPALWLGQCDLKLVLPSFVVTELTRSALITNSPNACLARLSLFLLRSFWAARICWKEEVSRDDNVVFDGSKTRRLKLMLRLLGGGRLLNTAKHQRVKYGRFLFKIQSNVRDLFWTAFLIQLFTAVHWGRTSRDIQTIFRTWNGEFSLVGSVVCQLAGFEMSVN